MAKVNIEELLSSLSEEDKTPPEYYPLDLALQYLAYGYKPIAVNSASTIYRSIDRFR